MTTILTLRMNAEAQAHFDQLRKEHYPPHLNRIAAHLTLFHALPDGEDIAAVLRDATLASVAFSMRVSSLMNLGRGVAYAIASPELLALHAQLANAFASHLIPQDRQRFRPHIVVQNKATGDQARALRARLTLGFAPWDVQAEGLDWWDYLGGPWKLRETFHFAARARE